MAVIMVDCLHCNGAGKIPHDECKADDCQIIGIIWENYIPGHDESLTIRKCKVCGQLWKVRHQWYRGAGSDDIWLRPGESQRGYEFTVEEAGKYIDQ